MAFTNGYKKLFCESQSPRLIPEQEDGPELQGGLGGDTGSPFGEPKLPEHLQGDKAEPKTSYIQQLERKVEEIKGDIEDPNVSAASIANELVRLVRENTNWDNEKEATKGKTALIQILGNMGLKHMTASPDMQIPEQEDWEGYDQWNLKTKRGLHYFAYNQYLVAQGLGVTKLQHPGQHQTPHYESVMRENQEKLAVKLLQKTGDVDDAERILQKLGQWGPALDDIVRRLWVEKGWGDEFDAPGVNAGRDAPGQFIYDNKNRSGGAIAEGFDAVEGFLKKAMKLYFLPITFPIELIAKAIRGDANSREQAAAQDAISQANSENPDLGKVDLWQQIESRVEALEGGQSASPEQDPLQPHVTYAGANVGESTIPSLAVLEVLAKCDTHTFCNILESIGLRILGTHEFDPLDIRVEEQTVASLASNMTEAIDDDIDLDPELAAIKNLAESYGYVVEVLDEEEIKKAKTKNGQPYLSVVNDAGEEIDGLPDNRTGLKRAIERYPEAEIGLGVGDPEPTIGGPTGQPPGTAAADWRDDEGPRPAWNNSATGPASGVNYDTSARGWFSGRRRN
jgi:hypothetical protein